MSDRSKQGSVFFSDCVFLDVFQKFLFFVLKSSDVLDILVPILFYLNDARADQCEYREVVCTCACARVCAYVRV